MRPFSIFLVSFSIIFVHQNLRCTCVKSKTRAWIAPYQIAGPRIDDEAKPPARPTTEWEFPNIFLWGALQFSDPVIGCLALIPYSAAFPAFIWLTGTSRTPLMKSWYSGFNLGFMSFGFVLKFSLLIGIFPILAAILACLTAPVGVYGFMHPDQVFPFCGILWASFIVCNMVYVTCLSQESVLVAGAGYHWIFLLLATACLFFLLWMAQRGFRRTSQNAITAITNSYGAVASASYCWTFFSGGKESAFDILSFTSYPSQFKWKDPTDVFFFLLFLILIAVGMAIDYRRDLAQESPGFGGGKDEPAAPVRMGGPQGIDLQRGPLGAPPKSPQRFPSSSEASEPFLLFPGQDLPAGRKKMAFIDDGVDSGDDSDLESLEQEEEFVMKWIDPGRVLEDDASRATTADAADLTAPFPVTRTPEREEEQQWARSWLQEAARS